MSNISENPTQAPVVVFVVEDDEMVQELLVSALEEGGFAVMVTTSGDEALAILEKDDAPIRAGATDVDLGGPISGWDVAKRAREIHPDMPIVYMTGGHANEWSANGVPNSILLTKPFAPAQIVSAVSQLINAAAAGNSAG